mmetsp:Transcript_31924/g.70962  ORF Transcript_31924/g.70962 Transcript_31924/m.70962 type:complete len:210 (+) Transcript_31924:1748-2377(+)
MKLMRSKVSASGPLGTGRSLFSQNTKRGALGSPNTSSLSTPASTAICSMASLGWKLLGPSSQMKPSASSEVMFPPTLSLASVTKKLDMPCFAARACAVTRPEMPPPTITASYTWSIVFTGPAAPAAAAATERDPCCCAVSKLLKFFLETLATWQAFCGTTEVVALLRPLAATRGTAERLLLQDALELVCCIFRAIFEAIAEARHCELGT